MTVQAASPQQETADFKIMDNHSGTRPAPLPGRP